MRDERLKGITFDEYRWASYYLIENNLVTGTITTTRAGSFGWAGRIKRRGIDIIEKLIDGSVEQVVQNKISFIAKTSSYVEQFTELLTIWAKNPDLLNQALEYFTHLVESVM